MRNIPVLMYHRVCKGNEGGRSKYVVEADVFRAQLRYFAEQGYYTPQLADVLAQSNGVVSGDKKPLVITFDDGYLDTYEHALPALRDFGFNAVVFVVTDLSLRTNSWDAPKGITEAQLMEKHQILELEALGIEIGLHGWSHLSLPLLNDDDLVYEFEQSKKVGEEILNHPIRCFAYPYGEVDERVKAVARKAGFVCAFAANSGPMAFHGDLFQIRRSIICNRADSYYMYTKLSGIEKSFRLGWSLAKTLIGGQPRYNRP